MFSAYFAITPDGALACAPCAFQTFAKNATMAKHRKRDARGPRSHPGPPEASQAFHATPLSLAPASLQLENQPFLSKTQFKIVSIQPPSASGSKLFLFQLIQPHTYTRAHKHAHVHTPIWISMLIFVENRPFSASGASGPRSSSSPPGVPWSPNRAFLIKIPFKTDHFRPPAPVGPDPPHRLLVAPDPQTDHFRPPACVPLKAGARRICINK